MISEVTAPTVTLLYASCIRHLVQRTQRPIFIGQKTYELDSNTAISDMEEMETVLCHKHSQWKHKNHFTICGSVLIYYSGGHNAVSGVHKSVNYLNQCKGHIIAQLTLYLPTTVLVVSSLIMSVM